MISGLIVPNSTMPKNDEFSIDFELTKVARLPRADKQDKFKISFITKQKIIITK
jgi:hypothetical protein